MTSATCEFRGHALGTRWTMRPALVGAGIVIPKAHFDRECSRCRHVDRVWADIEGPRQAQPRALTLSAWLEANGATVRPPPGEIVVPDQRELAALVARAQ